MLCCLPERQNLVLWPILRSNSVSREIKKGKEMGLCSNSIWTFINEIILKVVTFGFIHLGPSLPWTLFQFLFYSLYSYFQLYHFWKYIWSIEIEMKTSTRVHLLKLTTAFTLPQALKEQYSDTLLKHLTSERNLSKTSGKSCLLCCVIVSITVDHPWYSKNWNKKCATYLYKEFTFPAYVVDSQVFDEEQENVSYYSKNKLSYSCFCNKCPINIKINISDRRSMEKERKRQL